MTVDAMSMPRQERAGDRPVAWWIFPTVPLMAAAIAFGWTLHLMLLRLYGMTGPSWDLGYDQQVIWDISVGQGFYSSYARADFLGIHFELILVVLAAVEKLWPNPAVLLIFSSAGLAATAPAAYFFFRSLLPDDRPASPWLAVALSAPVPFWPPPRRLPEISSIPRTWRSRSHCSPRGRGSDAIGSRCGSSVYWCSAAKRTRSTPSASSRC